MHEVSIAEGIIEVVTHAAHKAGVKALKEVRVAVGELSGVEIEALRFAFESVKKGTVAERAALVIERPEGTGWCMRCGKTVPAHRLADPCPLCGGFEVIASGGREMRVIDMVPADD